MTAAETNSLDDLQRERARLVRDLCLTEASTLASRYNLAAAEICETLKRFVALQRLAQKAARKYSADASEQPYFLAESIRKTFLPRIACSMEKPTDVGEANLATFLPRLDAEVTQALERERERLHNMGLTFV